MPSLPEQYRLSRSRRLLPVLAGLGALALAGCGQVASPTADVQQVSGDVGAVTAPPSVGSTIAFETFDDDVGALATTESRVLIRNARGYQAFFGHAAPAAVDFSSEWVMFYAAGTKPTGGYDASFLAVLRAGGSLIAITRLGSPGASCGTTQALTTPYALIKLPAQPGTFAQFFKQDGTNDCGPNLCAATVCPAGTTCDATTGKCIPAPVRCGGIANIACPGVGRCVDDPNDSCDPNAGGADCGGICSCVQNVACTADTKFDSSPSVCACVPIKPVCPPVCAIYCQYGNVPDANGCPTCQCNPPPPDLCATLKCASGTHCDSGKCVSDGVACGGIAGKACPGFGKCIDDPNDSCDPAAGGADCGGICSCFDTVSCAVNTRFDSSPSVCTCVPATTICPSEKCTGPMPKVANAVCADGSIAGPVCALTADGSCGWTIRQCPPAPATAP
jgi:hypothetical protein